MNHSNCGKIFSEILNRHVTKVIRTSKREEGIASVYQP